METKTIKVVFILRELEKNEEIEYGDFHSLDDHALATIKNYSTIGKTAEDFSLNRKWYRVVSQEFVKQTLTTSS